MRNTLERGRGLQMAKSGGLGRLEGGRAWARGAGVCQGEPTGRCVGCWARGTPGAGNTGSWDTGSWGHLSCCTFAQGTSDALRASCPCTVLPIAPKSHLEAGAGPSTLGTAGLGTWSWVGPSPGEIPYSAGHLSCGVSQLLCLRRKNALGI